MFHCTYLPLEPKMKAGIITHVDNAMCTIQGTRSTRHGGFFVQSKLLIFQGSRNLQDMMICSYNVKRCMVKYSHFFFIPFFIILSLINTAMGKSSFKTGKNTKHRYIADLFKMGVNYCKDWLLLSSMLIFHVVTHLGQLFSS